MGMLFHHKNSTKVYTTKEPIVTPSMVEEKAADKTEVKKTVKKSAKK